MFSSADRVEMLGLGLGDVVPEVAGFKLLDRRDAGRIAIVLYQHLDA